jgi:hypothetical protein
VQKAEPGRQQRARRSDAWWAERVENSSKAVQERDTVSDRNEEEDDAMQRGRRRARGKGRRTKERDKHVSVTSPGCVQSWNCSQMERGKCI